MSGGLRASFPSGPGTFKLVMPSDMLIRAKQQGRVFTMKQVAEHNTVDDMWIVYDDMVFDVSKFARTHPGGIHTIQRFAGQDATDEIRQMHPDWVLQKKLPLFFKGLVSDPVPLNKVQVGFREMFEELNKEGLFEPTPIYYYKKFALYITMWLSVFALVLGTNSDGLHLLAAFILAAFFQQAAFVGHDLGHNSVTIEREREYTIGLFWGNFFTGISIGWWKDSHNTHHVVPNSLLDDPDIQHLPAFAIHPAFFKNVHSTYHDRVMPFDWVARNIFIPYQHYLYYPIMAVARFNLWFQSFYYILMTEHVHRRWEELLSEIFFFGWMYLLIHNLNSNLMVALFLAISIGVSGILEVQITLSHFSQPVFLPGQEKYGGDFYTRQVVSSIDVDCPTWMDWFHGGLEKQTIHHLFPRLPRVHLRAIRKRTIAKCEELGLMFTEQGFIECNRLVLETLQYAASKSHTWSPLISHGFNAVG